MLWYRDTKFLTSKNYGGTIMLNTDYSTSKCGGYIHFDTAKNNFSWDKFKSLTIQDPDGRQIEVDPSGKILSTNCKSVEEQNCVFIYGMQIIYQNYNRQ